jgi:hypothetical protein
MQVGLRAGRDGEYKQHVECDESDQQGDQKHLAATALNHEANGCQRRFLCAPGLICNSAYKRGKYCAESCADGEDEGPHGGTRHGPA